MTEVMKIERIEPMPPQAVTPMDMIDRAISSGANVETLEKLLALQERWEVNQGRKAARPRHCGGEGEVPAIVKNQTANRGNAGSYRYEDLRPDRRPDRPGAFGVWPVLSLPHRNGRGEDQGFLHRLAPRRLQRNDHVGKRRGHLWGRRTRSVRWGLPSPICNATPLKAALGAWPPRGTTTATPSRSPKAGPMSQEDFTILV